MRYLVLTQLLLKPSTYKDEPFKTYHFPHRYLRQFEPGSIFVYYHSAHKAPKNTWKRYYFGFGVIGDISPDPDEPGHYFAQLLDARPFPQRVPLRRADGIAYESLGFQEVRRSEEPPWQSAVRPLSEEAFQAIVRAGGLNPNDLGEMLDLAETEANTSSTADWTAVLDQLNQAYAKAAPQRRSAVLNLYVDRGRAVVQALKKLLEPRCQICGELGFMMANGERYIEAHHLTPVAAQQPGSLCTDNLILVCPTCHRRLHYARGVSYQTNEEGTVITFADYGTFVVPSTRNCYLRISMDFRDRHSSFYGIDQVPYLFGSW